MSWGVSYFKDADGTIPAVAFLDTCPIKVRAGILAVLEAVRASPPPAFSGGGRWEAMHGSMAGFFEIRLTGLGRNQYRLFCLLENGTSEQLSALGFESPQIVAINGMVKANAALFTEHQYRRHVRDLADRYRAATPRSIAR